MARKATAAVSLNTSNVLSSNLREGLCFLFTFPYFQRVILKLKVLFFHTTGGQQLWKYNVIQV
jgi:hypothetical protein